MPEGLIHGIKSIGIDDLTPKEIKFLLRVLTKPEIENAIVFQELLQIMENLGLYEDEDGQRQDDDNGEQEEQYSDIEDDAEAQNL